MFDQKGQQGQQGQQGQGTLSNLTYDWLTFVQNKAQALQAYEQYIQDAEKCDASKCADFFRQAKSSDEKSLAEAKKHLIEVLQKECNS